MFLPYTTNCYQDGPPLGTIALILANGLVFAGVQMGWIAVEEWSSDFSSWNPLGWLRSSFLHAEWGHIIGNVIWLWVFGQVLEGAVGTRAFLIMCLAFVLGSGAVETLTFQGVDGGSYGASGLVYAIFTAGWLAAPGTKICAIFGFRYYVKPQQVVVPATLLAAIFIALEVLGGIYRGVGSKVMHGGETPLLLSTPVLHLISAAIGGGVAYVGLKLKWLDAGGWDVFSKGYRERAERKEQRVGDFVMPTSNSAIPEPSADVPTCVHCGRVRPAHKPRCTYCGLA